MRLPVGAIRLCALDTAEGWDMWNVYGILVRKRKGEDPIWYPPTNSKLIRKCKLE
jgi:hypothetical protein